MNSGQLQIERRTLGEMTILDCSGRIVVRREAEFLFDAAAFAIERSRGVLINLSGVSAVDSGGLGILIMLRRFAQTFSCDLKFCNASIHVGEILKLTGLTTVLDLYLTEQQAIESHIREVGAIPGPEKPSGAATDYSAA
jgi:anti-sigma B factor antagonist